MKLTTHRHLSVAFPILLIAAIAMVSAACTARSAAIPSATAVPSEAAGGGTTSGDVPDNAVFLTYGDRAHGFSIEYVEGWQVAPDANGAQIRDKDSSEVIRVVPAPSDIAAYVSGTDLPALGSEAGYRLVKQDTVTVNGQAVIHVSYEILSAPDPVTGKQVNSLADRYYLAGPRGLAIVTLATPKGVDNVDAFRRMIESFRWT